MPLEQSGSKAAFSRNVATERKAGRKLSQAFAIAYSVRRKAMRTRDAGPPGLKG